MKSSLRGRKGFRVWRRYLLRNPYIYLLAALIVIVVIFVLLRPMLSPFIEDRWEDISYFVAPSADRAYAYGDIHLNPSRPADYDIDRAQYFFAKAAAYDPPLPFVYHQLARIAFIEGNLPKALTLIDFQIDNEGDASPSSYYVRGLIEGSEGDYADAEKDYAHFLELEPINWAGANDYAWVLLKDNKPQMADAAVQSVLPHFPNNAWLLNTDSIALYEMGDATTAKERLDQAAAAAATLSPQDWSRAYPGNDPDIAAEGLAALKQAIQDNMQRVDAGQPI